jgi:WD40 repeat protein
VSDLDILARAATRELLDTGVPDVSGRYAELKQIRSRRTAAKVAGVVAAVALVAGGWQLSGSGEHRTVQPTHSTTEVHNGALLGIKDLSSAGSSGVSLVYGGNGPYGGMNDHLPTDMDSEPLMQFSPDGATFYYSDNQGKLVSWDLATQRKTELADCPDRGCLSGSISPDGSTGIFLGDGNAVLVDLATGASRSLSVPVTAIRTPAWSPDGARLVFSSASGLWTMDADGSNAKLVRASTAQDITLTPGAAWSPDGGRIAFFDRSDDGDYTLMTVRPDGTDPAVVHAAGGCECERIGPPSVVWSPDGKELAVTTSIDEPDQPTGVYTVGADGDGWTLRAQGDWSLLAWQPVSGG